MIGLFEYYFFGFSISQWLGIIGFLILSLYFISGLKYFKTTILVRLHRSVGGLAYLLLAIYFIYSFISGFGG